MSSHFLRYFLLDPFHIAGNEDMYKRLNQFEIWHDATTGFHGNHSVIIEKMLSAL